MNYNTASFKDVEKEDINYIRNVLFSLKDNLSYDKDFYGGWVLNNERPLVEYFFEEENTILNPKELEGYMEEIIENELKLKK